MKCLPSNGLSCVLALLLAFLPVSSAAQDPAPPQQAAQPAADPSVSSLTLEDGTPVSLGVCALESSGGLHVGEILDFKVRDEIKIGDLVVVPLRSPAWATVTDVQPPGRLLKDGRMTLRFDSVRLATGQIAPLRAVKEFRGASGIARTANEVLGIAAASLLLSFVSLKLLAVKGQEIRVTEKIRFTGYVDGSLPMSREKLLVANSPDVEISARWVVSPAAVPDSLRLDSEPGCAEVEVDGHYLDLTPTFVQLPPGQHVLTFRRAGFQPFEMKLRSPTSTGTITANLETKTKE